MASSDHDKPPREAITEFEAALKGDDSAHYLMRLYVAGMSARSRAAVDNLRAICEQHLSGRCELEVVDIYQHPERAREAQLIAAPTLVRELPLPVRRLLGDLSNTDKVLVGLDLTRR